MIFSPRSNTGIDIGQRTLKAVKLKKKGKKLHLDNYFFHDLTESSDLYPNVGSLSEIVKSISEVKGLGGASVAACIDDSEVETFDLEFPQMPKKKLMDAIMNEVEQRISFPVEEAIVGHVFLNDAASESLTIKVYCTKRERVERVVSLLTTANLATKSLDVAMLANVAMLDFNGYLSEGSTSAILDIGESRTSIGLINGKKLTMINSIPFAMGTINRSLMEKRGISYAQAEALKVASSLSHDYAEAEVIAIVDGIYLELFQQLQRSIEFYRATARAKIDHIFMLGGGSQFTSICKTVEQTCHVATMAANPFRNIEIFTGGSMEDEKLAAIAPYMGTAVGLALRGLDGN